MAKKNEDCFSKFVLYVFLFSETCRGWLLAFKDQGSRRTIYLRTDLIENVQQGTTADLNAQLGAKVAEW